MRLRVTLTAHALLLVLLAAGSAVAIDAPGIVDEATATVAPDDGPAARLLEGAGGSGSNGGGGGGQPVVVDPVGGDVNGLIDDPVVLAAVAASGAALAVALYGGARFVTKDSVLENDTRNAIFSYVKSEVGANLKQITDALDLTTTNAIWHLRKLEDAGLVRSKRFNGYKVFYPAEGGVEARRMSLSVVALSNDNAQAVFEYVVANPGAHQREIARALGVNHGTVRWHLKKLRKAEILTEVREGKASTYYPTEMGLAALANVQADEAPRRPIANVQVQG